MAGIWIAAVITTLFSVGIIGFLIAKISPVEDRRFLAVIAAVHLPMCALEKTDGGIDVPATRKDAGVLSSFVLNIFHFLV